MLWPRRLVLAAVTLVAVGCSSISTARVQPDNVYVGPGLRPVAVVHAQVTSAYFMFAAIPGHVSLDYVVNRMLLPAAKALGADKVVNLKVDITPTGGIWTLRKVLGWRTAEATGIAVVVEEPKPEPPAPKAAP
jgi:hypothetical protein